MKVRDWLRRIYHLAHPRLAHYLVVQSLESHGLTLDQLSNSLGLFSFQVVNILDRLASRKDLLRTEVWEDFEIRGAVRYRLTSQQGIDNCYYYPVNSSTDEMIRKSSQLERLPHTVFLAKAVAFYCNYLVQKGKGGKVYCQLPTGVLEIKDR